MLLRTVVLLLLCVSTGMCASLVSLQAQEMEREKEDLTEKLAVVADAVVAAAEAEAAVEKGEAAALDQASDTPAEEKPEEKILAVDNPEADKHKVKEAEDPGEDSDRSAGDSPAVEALGVIQELPSSAEEDTEIKPVQTNQSSHRPSVKQDNNTWGLSSIRNSFQAAHGYFDSLVELVGGRDGVCQYRCRYGEVPQPRPGYQLQEPNGCSSSLVGLQLDLGIPAMTECCNQLDMCYDTCGTSKYDCDLEFRSCLHGICSNLKKSLGFVSQVQACESVADVLYNTVWTLGCRPYMNSQRAACVCDGEERDEL
ncbi:group XIIB secretory phospholipase A2-like protein isoform X2 [Solea solea]|uniref:group XIIB secretory phospholipase A2-like protein isoform X2 n=1 Tax=Solea solea TaxID=90069 RepID=UPI00272DA136|nr:group XIIB secretory phospholipase A2-like protein isoform X2 [Solea solea]